MYSNQLEKFKKVWKTDPRKSDEYATTKPLRQEVQKPVLALLSAKVTTLRIISVPC